ncbi:MAG: PF20097 family protein [Planctomycetaceae bacterium]|nr:PF20097 family protein [Planctomycetaceae bacterium]
MSNSPPTCPFCGGPTESGELVGASHPLKWVPQDMGLTMGIWAFGCETVGTGWTHLGRPKATGYRCENCRKIVLDY